MKNIIKTIILFVTLTLGVAKTYSQVAVGVSFTVGTPPPPLPVYTQPPCPTDGYMWSPGYWAYDNVSGGYYWVPGVWVPAPEPGYLWTPGYWGYQGGFYGFYPGYWGLHVGYYGGINYGCGYLGVGFVGGEWSGGRFRYNTAVMNVNTTVIHNTYINRTVINNTTVNNHYSFNGPGGVTAQPRPEERAAMQEHHIAATSQQVAHQQTASHNRAQFASVNHGRPATTAYNRVGGHSYTSQGQQRNTTATHPSAINNTAAHQPVNNHTQQPVQHQQQMQHQPMQAQHQQRSMPMQQHQQHMPMQQHNAPMPHDGGGGGGGHDHDHR